MVVFLLMQTVFPSSTDSVDSGNWVNFLECKRVLWNNIRSFERHASMFWNYLDWSQLFFVNKYACSQFSESFNWSQLVFCDIKYAFSCSSANGRGEHIVLCHLFRNTNRKVSRCFYEEVEAPSHNWNPQLFLGGGLVFPNSRQYIMYAYICFLGGGGR